MRVKSLFLGAVIFLSLAAVPVHAKKVTVSATRSLASAPFFIAVDKGFFQERGIEIEFIFFNAAQPVAVAVASGDALIGITGLSAGFYNMAGKQALSIIAGGAREEPSASTGAYFVSNKAYQNGLQKIQDLPGHSFGLTSAGSPYLYSLALAAEKYSFDLSDIRKLHLQNFNNILSAIKGNRVDAGLLNSYVALPAAKRGDGRIIAWVGDETPWQLGAVFTGTNTIKQQRDLVQRVVDAYREGTRVFYDAFIDKNSKVSASEKAELMGILKKYSRLDEEQVLSSLNYVDREGRLDVADIRKQLATWQRLGMVDSGVRAADVIDESFTGAL